MRAYLKLLALLLASVLLVASCGGEQGSAPEKEDSTASPAPPAPAAEPETLETSTLAITNSRGERAEFKVEIADENAEQKQGLSERTALAEDSGMLFVFDREQPRTFQMRETLIPLSIAFIDAAGFIIDIQDMKPLDQDVYPSAAPAQYALEVNQGFFREQGVEVGDEVELQAPQGDNG